jgi:hypothetical protein
MGADGMPVGDDLVSATGATKDEARDHAIERTEDITVQDALRASIH